MRKTHQQIVCIVKWGFLIIKGREAHALEMPPVTLLPPHHDPHGAPLCYVHWLDDQWHLIHKADSSCDVVQDPNMLDLQEMHKYSFGLHTQKMTCVLLPSAMRCQLAAEESIPVAKAWACFPKACTPHEAQT